VLGNWIKTITLGTSEISLFSRIPRYEREDIRCFMNSEGAVMVSTNLSLCSTRFIDFLTNDPRK
jgi:hypothetical protein